MSEGGCKGCHGPLYSLGSFYACRNAGCESFAVPMNADGTPKYGSEGPESAEELAAFSWSAGSPNADLIAQGQREDDLLDSENMGQETVALPMIREAA